MSGYDWLLLLHLLGVFVWVAVFILLSVSLLAARSRERPSEVAQLLALARVGSWLGPASAAVILIFGLALAFDRYSITDGWILAALVLWLVIGAAASRSGAQYGEALGLARRHAGQGDEPSPELAQRVRDPHMLTLHWVGGLATLGTLVLMIYKPGA